MWIWSWLWQKLSMIGTAVRRAGEKSSDPQFTVSITIPFRQTGYDEVSIQDTITIERRDFTDLSTIGELCIDGDFFCFTLEDTCRSSGIKIHGKTAIPQGRYRVIIDMSPRFKRLMPHVLEVNSEEVNGFEGIRIHKGNSDQDTEGCILLGMHKGTDIIYDSKKAYDLFYARLEERLKDGPVYMSIIGGRTKLEV
jgi:hypothetical protein